LETFAGDQVQSAQIRGEIEGIGAGHKAAMANDAPPDADLTTHYGRAFARGARTGFAAALNDRIAVELDEAARAAGDDVAQFDKAVGKISSGFATLPPDLGAAAAVSLSEKGLQYRAAIEATRAKKQAEAAEFTSRQAVRLHSEDAQAAAYVGNMAGVDAARRAHHVSVGALIGQGMSAQEATAAIQKLDYEIEEQRALGGFARAAKVGAAAAYTFVGRLTDAVDAFSTPDTRARVLRTLEGSLSAMAADESRRQAAADRHQKKVEEQTSKTATDLLYGGGLTMDWLRRNKAGLSDTDYQAFSKAAAEPRPPRTDIATYVALQDRALAGEDVRAEVKAAALAGKLSQEKFEQLSALVRSGFDRAIKEAADRISAFTGASGFFADDLSRQRNQLATEELLRWRDQQVAAGKSISPVEARAVADRALEAWSTVKPGDVPADPRFLVRNAQGGFDAPATRAATQAARAAGRLSQGEAEEEYRRIDILETRERNARAAAEELKKRGVR